MNGLLSVREVAELTGQNEKLVRRAIADGQCPSVRWGRRILVPKGALDRLINGEDEDTDYGMDDRPDSSITVYGTNQPGNGHGPTDEDRGAAE